MVTYVSTKLHFVTPNGLKTEFGLFHSWPLCKFELLLLLDQLLLIKKEEDFFFGPSFNDQPVDIAAKIYVCSIVKNKFNNFQNLLKIKGQFLSSSKINQKPDTPILFYCKRGKF